MMRSYRKKPYVSRREKNQQRAFQFRVFLYFVASLIIFYVLVNWNDIISYLKTYFS